MGPYLITYNIALSSMQLSRLVEEPHRGAQQKHTDPMKLYISCSNWNSKDTVSPCFCAIFDPCSWPISPDSDSYRGSHFQQGGEGDEPLWRIGRGTRVPLQGAVCWVPLAGAIVVCYGWGG